MAVTEEHVVTTFDYNVNDKQLKESIGTWQTSKRMMQDGNVLAEKQVRINKDGTKEIKNITQETRKFRGEYLSLMFLGMGISRIFGGQISRMYELTGTKSIVQAFWTEALIDPMLKVQELTTWLYNHFPDIAKTPIGYTAVAVTGIGDVLSWIGMSFLGLKGIEEILGIKLLGAGGYLSKFASFEIAGTPLALGIAGILADLTASMIAFSKLQNAALSGATSTALPSFAETTSGAVSPTTGMREVVVPSVPQMQPSINPFTTARQAGQLAGITAGYYAGAFQTGIENTANMLANIFRNQINNTGYSIGGGTSV
ncbi:hypothetical protein M0R04_11235 [Candidatus Dojkabacteria bacterium]|jgi:hypothetical protein|nr:hypothetical protein [Candidatus Dojkabacteria bacterium]